MAQDKVYNHELIDGGFNEFHGTLPQDTVTGYNGRAFEVYQLQAFAEYGDKISQYWLDEIKRKTNNNYNISHRVSDYIGQRRRQDEEKLFNKKATANNTFPKAGRTWWQKLFGSE